jgi:3-hydroxybutyrate dehydrogenase
LGGDFGPKASMLKNKTALITGSTAGIGYAIAEHLAADGCNIVLNGLEAEAVVADKITSLQASATGGVMYDGADVGVAAEVEAMVDNAIERFGSVDILVNNAVSRVFGAIEDITPGDWDRALAVNLTSAFNTIRCVMPGMKARNWGRIINISSIYGLRGVAERSSYVVAKTALIGLTRVVALETLDYEITCNAVCPGSVNTTRSSQAIKDSMMDEDITEEEAVERFLAGKQPSGRFITSESVGEYVAFLCGSGGREISGAVMPVDMGWSAA